jgi:predicted nuclease of predicted toxin-antitoxin system
VKILIDMNLSPEWTGLLASRGWDACHWSQVGAPNASDLELLAYARENSFVIIAQDIDSRKALVSRNPQRVSCGVDTLHFLKLRTAFIRQLYATASHPYIERKRAIEAEEAPWVPPYSEDEVPPFVDEWIEADKSIQVLGATCISMLSSALHLYLKEWQKRIGVPTTKSAFKDGWVRGYKSYLEAHTNIDFSTCPVNLSVLEEIVLARNQTQHPSYLELDSFFYSDKDLKTLPSPMFMKDHDLAMHKKGEQWKFMFPAIQVTAEALSTALGQVELFATWIESD